jgi:hypothetical protein
MITIVLIGLFLPLSLSLECDVPGQCTESHFVTGLVTNSKIACIEECKDNTRANWYTFKLGSGYCELFANCTLIDDEFCKDCVSGEAECSTTQCGVTGLCEVIHGTKDRSEEPLNDIFLSAARRASYSGMTI